MFLTSGDQLLGVFFISKLFQAFSKPHKATQLLLTCLATQHATRDNRKTLFLKTETVNNFKLGG